MRDPQIRVVHAALLVSSVAAYAGTALCVIADETWRWVDGR